MVTICSDHATDVLLNIESHLSYLLSTYLLLEEFPVKYLITPIIRPMTHIVITRYSRGFHCVMFVPTNEAIWSTPTGITRAHIITIPSIAAIEDSKILSILSPMHKNIHYCI